MNASELTREQLPQIRNIPVYGADGEQLGHVGDAYYDEATERLACVGIAADAIGFAKRVVPVQGATIDDDGLHLAFGQTDIEGAPEIDEDEFNERYRGVSDYYGERAGTVTRHEEELAVEKRDVEAGQVKLRKWVETEPVEAEVELERETARIERETINEPAPGAELSEEEVELELRAEEPVVQKEIVAKERVGIEKGIETKEQTVSDELQKERVEVEGETRDDR
jgi:uncharacterized protein (TIGR02271 family)